MKKFIAILAVLAITGISAMAFAADVTLGGSYEIRSRMFDQLNMTKDVAANISGDTRDTQTRIRLDVNAKAGDVKGKLQFESDFGTGSSDWGKGFDTYSVSSASQTLGFREAWVMFPLPGVPVTIKGGHQLLQLGNGWFFRSQHFGSDAWVAFNDTGNNHLGFVNVKVSEGQVYQSDDIDAYVIVDTYKINDNNKVGIDLTNLVFRQTAGSSGNNLYNLGLNYNGKLGPVALKAQIDLQSGKNKLAAGDSKYKGNDIVIEASMPMDPLTLNLWLAQGSGEKSGNDTDRFVNFLDIDPHYTFLYEYKMVTASGSKNTGFANTQAIGLGATFAASKSLTVGANFWYLKATEKTNLAPSLNAAFSAGATSDKVGTEIDLILNWKVYDNLTWNWAAGYFMPGDAYKGTVTATGAEAGTEKATGIQGVLKFSF